MLILNLNGLYLVQFSIGKVPQMANNLVTVIIPTYNRAYCVGRAIESVRAQTHSNWELLLVDDGSTDNTADLIAANYGSDSRIHYIQQANAGVSAARNTGISAAQGAFIAFLDSDDVWKPWKLEVQLACFQAFPDVGMVWTEFEAVNSSGELVKDRYLRTMYGAYRYFPVPEDLFSNSHNISSIVRNELPLVPEGRVYVGNIYASMLRGNLVHTSTVMLSRERMEKVKGFDVDLVLSGEDYDFHFRTCKWGDVGFVDAPSTTYQLEFEDRLTKFKLRVAENFLKTVQKAIEREKDTNRFPPSVIREVLAEAHGWLAGELFQAGDNVAARNHALSSLHYNARQPRLMTLVCISYISPTIFNPLLHSFRRTKRMLRPQS